MTLVGKSIVLGVCGGIAAYKSAELVRLIQKQGAQVRVVMTRNAASFIAPLTFEALSGQPVCMDLFEKGENDTAIRHIEWAKQADAVVVAPATANIIGKLAAGLADDALTTFMLALTCPVIICPSMNTHMYENRAVQRNIDSLEEIGYTIVEPGSGDLACGTKGAGRLPEPEYIVDRLMQRLYPKDFLGKHVLVTAGPTREPIDPVRFISNHSSGKMGYAIARAAEYRGADVTLISGPTRIPQPLNVKNVEIETAQQMHDAVFAHMADADIIIKVAAVADYRPVKAEDRKIKKSTDNMRLELRQNADILKALGKGKTHQILVGFAAETQDLKQNALKKLAAKNLDLIVGNIVGSKQSGFDVDTNQVTLFFKDGTQEALPLMDKDRVAHTILDRIQRMAGQTR